MVDCDARSPLIRSGTTQGDRDLAELRPEHFRLDERELPDLVLYAQALSREIAFRNASNQLAGDWEPFFDSDITAALARLARLPVAPFRTALADAEEFLKEAPDRSEPQLRAYLNLTFHLPVALFGALAQGHARLPRDHPLHARLTRLVAEDLAGPLTSLAAYFSGALGAGLPLAGPPAPALSAADFGTGLPGDARPRLSDTVAALVLVPEALDARVIEGPSAEALGAADWAAFAGGVTALSAPYLQATGPNLVYDQIYEALSYNLLSTELERVFQALERARGLAAEALDASLSEVKDHAPHYGLFLGFLEMLAVARTALNGMTAKHLDFYYGKVLRMAPRAPVLDSAHVLLELAKGVEAHLKPAGTGMKAGKDATGVPVTYKLADDIVVNRGEVAELRAVRVHETGKDADKAVTLHASPVADSADGLGSALPADAIGWPPFGPTAWVEGEAKPLAPFARIGFAVADRKLFLREGKRTIKLRVKLEAAVPSAARPKLDMRLTTPKGWLTIEGRPKVQLAGGGTELVVTLTLAGDQPPIVAYDPNVHLKEDGSGYAAGLPVAECLFAFEDRDDHTARGYAALRNARFETIKLRTKATRLRNLALQTPNGAADPSKPFAPFGARPKPRAAFLIGSAEVFAKPLEALKVRFDWETTYHHDAFFADVDADDYTASISYLTNATWKRAATDQGLMLTSPFPTIAMPEPELADGTAALSEGNPIWGPGAATGFLRLELNATFGHDGYLRELTRANIAMARGTQLAKESVYNYDRSGTDGWTPKAPYELMVREIYVNYVTPLSAPARLYHVAPFGQDRRPLSAGRLLPHNPFSAALFVGVKGFKAPARLTLLAQVANGSGDPLLEVPELQFDYLSGDDWKGFEESEVDDKTGNFAASAVLGLAAPEKAGTVHAVMPTGLHWLRISASENAAAVNRLIALKAQAARAVFEDAGNDPQFLATPTPAGALERLTVPDPKVKKVVQPYVSYDGRPKESAESFRRRASERLRHKDRASTIWDYERLALEAAPELYRVKCINHAELVREGRKVIADNELSPGGVVVVTVPWTEGRPHLDRLRPYADQATLKRVRDALTPRVSPFVRLEVANPKFEEVQVDFKVAFLEGIADTAFYHKELEKAVIGYLAPWSVAKRRGADITFGGKLRKSTIIDFVEELPYVDYLEDFRLYHRPDPEADAWTPVDQETVEATTARSILVSAAAHTIAKVA